MKRSHIVIMILIPLTLLFTVFLLLRIIEGSVPREYRVLYSQLKSILDDHEKTAGF